MLSSSEQGMQRYRVHLQSLTNEFLGHLYLVFSLRLGISRSFETMNMQALSTYHRVMLGLV